MTACNLQRISRMLRNELYIDYLNICSAFFSEVKSARASLAEN